MKKFVFMFLTLFLLLSVVGCGGGKPEVNNPSDDKPTGYYYKWGNGVSPLTYNKPVRVNGSTVYAASLATYLGKTVPPFTALDDLYRQSGTLLIYTYYNDAPVNSAYSCDPNDGSIGEYDLSGDGTNIAASFTAKKHGIFHITATYNGETLDIPIRIYRFSAVDLNDFDLDNDGITDIKDLTAVYGCQIVDSNTLPLVTNALPGDYSQTMLTKLEYTKIYIIKTSSGRFLKLLPTGTCGTNQYNSMNLLSNTDGAFPY
jgi:hypothetical protein